MFFNIIIYILYIYVYGSLDQNSLLKSAKILCYGSVYI